MPNVGKVPRDPIRRSGGGEASCDRGDAPARLRLRSLALFFLATTAFVVVGAACSGAGSSAPSDESAPGADSGVSSDRTRTPRPVLNHELAPPESARTDARADLPSAISKEARRSPSSSCLMRSVISHRSARPVRARPPPGRRGRIPKHRTGRQRYRRRRRLRDRDQHGAPGEHELRRRRAEHDL